MPITGGRGGLFIKSGIAIQPAPSRTGGPNWIGQWRRRRLERLPFDPAIAHQRQAVVIVIAIMRHHPKLVRR